jgi:hypothetical protein
MLSAAEGYKPPATDGTKPVENRFRRLNTVSEPTSSGFLVCSSGGFQPGVASTQPGVPSTHRVAIESRKESQACHFGVSITTWSGPRINVPH